MTAPANIQALHVREHLEDLTRVAPEVDRVILTLSRFASRVDPQNDPFGDAYDLRDAPQAAFEVRDTVRATIGRLKHEAAESDEAS